MGTKGSKPRTKHAPAAVAAQVIGRVQAAAVTTHFSARAADHMVGKVRFGRVVVEAATPSAAQAKRNIAAGHSALGRAKTALLKPGVHVRVAPDVPLYHADPATPGVLVRTLNGQTTRGRLVAGRFKPI